MTEVLLQTSMPTGMGGGQTESQGIVAMDLMAEGQEMALVLPVPDDGVPQVEWSEPKYYVVVKAVVFPQYLWQMIIVRML